MSLFNLKEGVGYKSETFEYEGNPRPIIEEGSELLPWALRSKVSGSVKEGIYVNQRFVFAIGTSCNTEIDVSGTVMGNISLKTTRMGALCGNFRMKVASIIDGNILYLDDSSDGGFAGKTFAVTGNVRGNLIVTATGRMNLLHHWSFTVTGSKRGEYEFEGSKDVKISETQANGGDRLFVLSLA